MRAFPPTPRFSTAAKPNVYVMRTAPLPLPAVRPVAGNRTRTAIRSQRPRAPARCRHHEAVRLLNVRRARERSQAGSRAPSRRGAHISPRGRCASPRRHPSRAARHGKAGPRPSAPASRCSLRGRLGIGCGARPVRGRIAWDWRRWRRSVRKDAACVNPFGAQHECAPIRASPCARSREYVMGCVRVAPACPGAS